MQTSRFVSGGTWEGQVQDSGSYPETFYGPNIPLDQRLFGKYLEEQQGLCTMCPPIGSGYAMDNVFSPAGGVTDEDIMAECNGMPCCDPHLPDLQNQYSFHSQYQDLKRNACLPNCTQDKATAVDFQENPNLTLVNNAVVKPQETRVRDESAKIDYTWILLAAAVLIIMLMSRA